MDEELTTGALLIRTREQIADLRVSVGQIEARGDEHGRALEAHRQRLVTQANSATGRFDAMASRIDSIDHRQVDLSHRMTLVAERQSDQATRIGRTEDCLRQVKRDMTLIDRKARVIQRLEVVAPIILVIAAVTFKLMTAEQAMSLIPK